MIAEKTIVLYNKKSKIAIAEVQPGWEYFSNEDVFEGTLDEFLALNIGYSTTDR